MRWLSKLFSRKRAEREPLPEQSMAVAIDRGRQDQVYAASGADDLLTGWSFGATLQLRTPLRILEHDGEFCPLPGPPPQIATEQWHGAWVPKTKTWSELTGIPGIPEFVGAGRASDIGTVPVDGGDYLKFLLAVRRIVEAQSSTSERIADLTSELKKAKWAAFVEKHGGEQRIFERFFKIIRSSGEYVDR